MRVPWSAQKWIASSSHPISSRLALQAPKGKNSRRACKLRVNIVDPSLCDDSLQRLAPSLQEYRNCDIVDINPGACLWSSKLHNVLQPRHHLLVEPDKDVYEQYIEPLLNAPGSRYRHVSLDTRDYSNFDKLLGHGLLPEQEQQDRMGFSSLKINRTLLVNVNLTSRECDIFGEERYVKQSVYMGYGFLKSYLMRSIFNKYGLVRVLMWAPGSQTDRFLPKSASERTKDSVLVDLATKADVVTCSQAFSDRDIRDYRVHVQEHHSISSMMKQGQVFVPEARRLKLKEPGHLEADRPASEIPAAFTKLADKQDWIEEWVNLEEGLDRGDFSMERELSSPKDARTRNYSAEAKKLRLYRQRFDADFKAHKLIISLLDRRLNYESTQRLNNAQISNEGDDIEQELRKLSRVPRRTYERFLDDYRLSKDPSAGLQWGQRRVEPLINHEEEFYPQQCLSLMDFRPLPSNLDQVDDHEKVASILYFLDRLFNERTASLSTVLEEIAPGSIEYFTSNVPALQTLMQNWRTEVSGLRACSVPSHVLLELALAWHSWPFRMSMDDLQREMPLSERAYFATF